MAEVKDSGRGYLVWNEKGDRESKLVDVIKQVEGTDKNYAIFTTRNREKVIPPFKGAKFYRYDWPDTKKPNSLENLVIIVDEIETLLGPLRYHDEKSSDSQSLFERKVVFSEEEKVINLIDTSIDCKIYFLTRNPFMHLQTIGVPFRILNRSSFPKIGSEAYYNLFFTNNPYNGVRKPEEFGKRIKGLVICNCSFKAPELEFEEVKVEMPTKQGDFYLERRAQEEKLLLLEPKTPEEKEEKNLAVLKIRRSQALNFVYPAKIQKLLTSSSSEEKEEKEKFVDNPDYQEGKAWLNKEFLSHLKDQYSPKFQALLCRVLARDEKGGKQVIYTSFKEGYGAYLLDWIMKDLSINHSFMTPGVVKDKDRRSFTQKFNKEKSGILLTTVVPPINLEGITDVHLVEFRPGQGKYHDKLLEITYSKTSSFKLVVHLYISQLHSREAILTVDEEYEMPWYRVNYARQLEYPSIFKDNSISWSNYQSKEESLEERLAGLSLV